MAEPRGWAVPPEARGMSGQVLVSRKLLGAVVGLLVVCLAAVIFLLGQRSGAEQARTSQSKEPPANAVSTPETSVVSTPAVSSSPVVDGASGGRTPSLEERLDALDGRVSSVKRRTGDEAASASPSADPAGRQASSVGATAGPVASTERAAVADYLKQVDEIVGASAMAGPLPISAKLLERGMTSDPSASDGLIQQTNEAKAKLAALNPPPLCQEHHTLLLGQLSEAVLLLREVKAADASGDTVRLAALAESSLKSQGEATRLFDLDRQLRLGVR